jgi:hypothetical protein
MLDFQLTHWFWLIAAVILGIMEILLPTTLMLWMAIAAGLVGLLLLVVPELAWQYQVLTFSALSVISIVGWRLVLVKRPIASDEPMLNRRGQQYVGRTFTLKTDIVNGVGKLSVGDTLWRVEGPELKAGTAVVVTGVDGMSLLVDRKAD